MDGVTGNQAFERLLYEYRDRVFRLACSLLGDEAAAEDAAQEIFLKIWKALPSFRGESSLSTWIYAIARNTCLTRRRIAADRRTFSLDEANGAETRICGPSSAGCPPSTPACWCCSTSKTGRTSRWRWRWICRWGRSRRICTAPRKSWRCCSPHKPCERRASYHGLP